MSAIRLELVEGVTKEIPKDEFDALRAERLGREFGEMVDVEFPSPLTGERYIFRSENYVGHIPVDEEFMLTIAPKIPVSNLFHLLEYAYDLKSFSLLEGTVPLKSIDEVFENLASILSRRAIDRARKGLYQGYVTQIESSTCVRGRILARESANNLARLIPRIECEYHENTIDLIENQILAWTLHILPRLYLTRPEVRSDARRAYLALAGAVQTKHIDPAECVEREYNRLNSDYKCLHALCRFILEHAGPSFEVESRQFLPFVVNMPMLFQSFVARWLDKHTPSGYRFSPQHPMTFQTHRPVTFHIDLVMYDSAGRAVAVIDTKYKPAGAPRAEDVHQMVSYATMMGAKQAFLVYPSMPPEPLDLLVRDISVRSLGFNIGADPEKAGEQFLHELLGAVESPAI